MKLVLATGTAVATSAYSISEAALDGITRAVTLEIGPQRIRINNINPGVIDTPMTLKDGGDDVLRPFVELADLNLLGDPADFGDVVVWLCSNLGCFNAGQSILLDGSVTILDISQLS